MKFFTKIMVTDLVVQVLGGCLASTDTQVGVRCDYSQGKPLWELPLVCQGGH